MHAHSLANKVNVDELASLMPQGGSGGADEAATASLMSKLIEIQNRLAQLEGETYMYMTCTTQVSDDLSAHKRAKSSSHVSTYLIKNANHTQPKAM